MEYKCKIVVNDSKYANKSISLYYRESKGLFKRWSAYDWYNYQFDMDLVMGKTFVGELHRLASMEDSALIDEIRQIIIKENEPLEADKLKRRLVDKVRSKNDFVVKLNNDKEVI